MKKDTLFFACLRLLTFCGMSLSLVLETMATETYSVSVYGLPANQTDSEHQVPSQDSVHLMPPVNLSLTGSQNVDNSGCYLADFRLCNPVAKRLYYLCCGIWNK